MKNKNDFPHVSFTQFDVYSQCAGLYKRLYKTERPRDDGNRNRIFGSFLHEVYASTNRFIKGLKDKKSFGLEDIEKIYSDEFKKVRLSLEDYHTGWNSLQKFAEETFNQRAEILLVEDSLTLELVDGDEGIAILAIPDRVDEVGDALKIIDYKLSPLIPSVSDVESSLQLNIYAFILRSMYPNKQIYLEQYSMIKGIGIKASVNDSIQAKLSGYMTDLWRKMKSDTEFTPTTCNRCQYCPEVCPLYTDYMRRTYESKGITTIEQAVETYEKVKTNFNILSKEKDNLKSYIESKFDENVGTPIQVGTKVVSLEVGSRSTSKIDKEQVCKDCKAITYGRSYFNTIEIAEIKTGTEKKETKKGLDKKIKKS